MEILKSEMAKRPRGTPTFLTPMRPKKKSPIEGNSQFRIRATQMADVAPLDSDIPEHDFKATIIRTWDHVDRKLMEAIEIAENGSSGKSGILLIMHINGWA